MSYSKRIARRRHMQPVGRNYEQVAQMLLDRIHIMPMVLMCKGCRGEHVLSDRSLTIHCACGAVTRYKTFGLFHAWSSLLWNSMLISRHHNVAGDTTALRSSWLTFADVVNEPLKSPQQPLDLRVHLWRTRRAR